MIPTMMLVLVMLLATLTVVQSKSIQWTGYAGDSQWTNPVNWDSNTVPTMLDDVTIGAGTVQVTIGTGVNSLVLGTEGAANLTVFQAFTVPSVGNGLYATALAALIVNSGAAVVTGNVTIAGGLLVFNAGAIGGTWNVFKSATLDWSSSGAKTLNSGTFTLVNLQSFTIGGVLSMNQSGTFKPVCPSIVLYSLVITSTMTNTTTQQAAVDFSLVGTTQIQGPLIVYIPIVLSSSVSFTPLSTGSNLTFLSTTVFNANLILPSGSTFRVVGESPNVTFPSGKGISGGGDLEINSGTSFVNILDPFQGAVRCLGGSLSLGGNATNLPKVIVQGMLQFTATSSLPNIDRLILSGGKFSSSQNLVVGFMDVVLGGSISGSALNIGTLNLAKMPKGVTFKFGGGVTVVNYAVLLGQLTGGDAENYLTFGPNCTVVDVGEVDLLQAYVSNSGTWNVSSMLGQTGGTLSGSGRLNVASNGQVGVSTGILSGLNVYLGNNATLSGFASSLRHAPLLTSATGKIHVVVGQGPSFDCIGPCEVSTEYQQIRVWKFYSS